VSAYDFERSFEIAKIGCPNGYCFPNAVRALRNRQRFVKHTVDLRGAKYIEGCVEIDQGIIIQHGWIELENGTILDPTLAAIDCGKIERRYFPLARYSRQELIGKRLNAFPIAMVELAQQQTALSRGEI